MAPFPETEIMTIKRLQVALRRMDFKLLKDGAYKLHEKYHSGFKFEYLDLLKEVLVQTMENQSIPEDIKDILCPTINDILSEGYADEPEAQDTENQSMGQTRVSNLTQMSYNASSKESNVAVEEREKQAPKISAFEVFGAPKTEKPRGHFTLPLNNHQSVPNELQSNVNTNAAANVNTNVNINTGNQINKNQNINKVEYNEPKVNEEQKYTIEQNKQEPQIQIEETVPTALKTIAINYRQDISNEKVKNILNYKEIISKFDDEHYSISQILKLISEINVQSDTNVSELKNIIDQIKISGNKLNLITNSSSRELIDLFEKEEYSYSLYSESSDKQITLIPVFGLTNQFLCSNCKEEYLDKNNPTKPLIIECPKCKNPMFPNFYGANNKNNQINMGYYNNALVSLANSNVWVLIHPSTEDKLFFEMLINAFKLNRDIETIYILEKDINTRESLRAAFTAINKNVKINVQMTALEDFLNSLK